VDVHCTSNLPFWAIITPESNSTLLLRQTIVLVQLHKTGAKVFSSLLDGLVILPDVRSVDLGLGVPYAASEALVLGNGIGGSFKKLVGGMNLSRSMRALKQSCISSHTLGSRDSMSLSVNLQCLYTAVLPGFSEPGRATLYGFPVSGGG
jgi:hypothetical protein